MALLSRRFNMNLLPDVSPRGALTDLQFKQAYRDQVGGYPADYR